ncbi:GNAT family N-acetyltransferase [Halomonas sp. KAO]|uniref:GNAT family N-acetyltransferase n=1 Tax=Halomonas sp. KAO TaxID=2783858 RepID=UPI00189EF944|nr:GNAT family N-acetyltransferase [Halomonas sp. KAO]MBF7054092.1 GNAT family N-acetyltransferase [Halomonas sp. KAO]
MKYLEINTKEAPIQILLEADPSEKMISSYLKNSWCYAAQDNGKIIGACVAKLIRDNTAEIFNISVHPNHQKKGIGTNLLTFTLKNLLEKSIHRVELGTGAFGYQLTYYHRIGFRVESVIKNYFINNYAEPIFENGIQHKDMLRLYIDIRPRI